MLCLRLLLILFGIWVVLVTVSCSSKEQADLIILNGKIITVDNSFTITEALAVKDDKIIAVGTEKVIKKWMGEQTKIINAEGRAVIPGLTDAHLHPEQASISELDSEIPHLTTVGELLQWISQQTTVKSKGEWIIIPKFFYTRLKEIRPPSLAELDEAAPNNPVFLDGTFGGVINSVALQMSGITKNTAHNGVLKDRQTGLPNGMVKRSAFELLKIPSTGSYSDTQKKNALIQMMAHYNKYGITSIVSAGGDFKTFEMYNNLKEKGQLTTRVFLNILLPKVPGQTADDLDNRISGFKYKTGDGDEWVKIGALKVVLDGGILTGTAYLREPWGQKAAEIYGIEDSTYRGILNYSFEELLPVVNAAAKHGWKFTAHSTGGGGMDILLDVFEEVNKSVSLEDKRYSIIYGNFFTPGAIERMARMGIYASAQAAWFYKDADAIKYILGDQRIKTFLPFRSLIDGGVVINGGSDHMVKRDPDQSINPYNPFLAMWSMITRTTENSNVIVPEEAVSREEALKIYTINNARASFEESLKGSIEPGKLADIVILNDDILTCPIDQIKHIKAELTIVGGKVVYSSGKMIKE